MSANTPPPPPPGAGDVPPPPSANSVGQQPGPEAVPTTGSMPQYPAPAYGTGQVPAYGGQMPMMQPPARKDGFFQALFDFSFSLWATPKVVKFLYILTWVLLGIYVLSGVLISFSIMIGGGVLSYWFGESGGLMGVLGFLNLLWVLVSSLFIATMIRVVLERSLATIRIAEILKENQESK